MTVSVSYAPLTYSGNDVLTQFSVTWPFFTGTLRVTLISSTGVETTQTISTHYTVSGGTASDGTPSTGTVTMVTAPATGQSVRIERVTPRTQALDLTAGGDFNPRSVMTAFDRLTLISQEGTGGGSDDITGDVMQLDSSGAQDFWDGEGKPVRMSFLELTEASAPATPDSGYGRVYTKSDGALYHKNDAGTETSLTGAAQSAAASATAASTSATNAATSETNAAASASAALAAASASSFKWNLDTSTSMADPGTGEIRFNNATWASVTAIAIADTSSDAGNPDVSAVVLTWDDSTNTAHRGNLTFRNAAAPAEFVTFSITGGSTDNSGWTQLVVTYVAGSPTWSAGTGLLAVFTRTGNAGANGAGSGDLLAANNLSDLASAATAATNLGLGTGSSPQFAGINIGHATDTTLTRASAGVVAVEGVNLIRTSDTASESAAGVVELATTAEATTGTDTARAVTPAGVAAAIAASSGFPSGTRMLFQQTAAPTGWTKDTTHNDKALRLVSGTVGTGGSNSFTTAMVNSFNSGATTLSTTQMPAHTHSYTILGSGGGSGYAGTSDGPASGLQTTGSTGGGGSHTHTVQLNVQYVDFILASKD